MTWSRPRDGAEMGAPHPIPKGKENVPCPINGMFLSKETEEAKEEMDQDPDIIEELKGQQVMRPAAKPQSLPFIPMQVINGAHAPSEATRRLVQQLGMEKLRRFTGKFYERSFVDPHIDQFIAEHSEPHAERFANWIAEKFGHGTPWTQERRTRPKKYMHFGDESMQVSHDRSTSHFAAWYSPKREPGKMGQHFKPDDARNWMRLHFWAARETGGLYDEHPDFMDYYERFIGHFVSIYSSKSPPFTRESARWSADPNNIQRYHQDGNRMVDILGKDVELEILKLPREEQIYTGSRHPSPSWPYNKEPLAR